MVRLPDHGMYTTDVLPAFIVTAFGAGMVFLPMTNAAVAGAEQQDAGLASALLNTSQQVGGAVGLALLSTIAASHTAAFLASDPKAGFAHALVAGSPIVRRGACIAVAAAVLHSYHFSGRGSGRYVPSRPHPLPAPSHLGRHRGADARHRRELGSVTSQLHRLGDIELRAGDRALGTCTVTRSPIFCCRRLPTTSNLHWLAHPHHVLPESNWVSVHIRRPEPDLRRHRSAPLGLRGCREAPDPGWGGRITRINKGA